jgi:hypothetical protein
MLFEKKTLFFRRALRAHVGLGLVPVLNPRIEVLAFIQLCQQYLEYFNLFFVLHRDLFIGAKQWIRSLTT